MTKFGFETEGIDLVREFQSLVKGRTFLITGPSKGSIGAETAISLAHSHPSHLILLGRSLPNVQPTISTINYISPTTTTTFIPIDLSLPSSIRAAASAILLDPSISPINTLINNAAIMAPPYTLTTPSNHESQLATNHLGPFLLTNLLLPKMAPSSRIINVSSVANRASGIRFDDLNYTSHPEEYTPFNAYGQSKTALILFSIALNKRLASRGIRSWAPNPGSIGTNLGTYMTPELVQDAKREVFGEGGEAPPRKTLQQGCATTLRAALDPALEDEEGVYLNDCQVTTDPKWIAPWALDVEGAERCWELSEELVGEKFTW